MKDVEKDLADTETFDALKKRIHVMGLEIKKVKREGRRFFCVSRKGGVDPQYSDFLADALMDAKRLKRVDQSWRGPGGSKVKVATFSPAEFKRLMGK